MLAKRPVLSASPSTVTPPSRAGSLPQWIFGGHKKHIHRKTLWERACSRRGRYFQHLHRLSCRLREQARSHIGFSAVTRCAYVAKPCGSEPAREEAGTFSISIDCHAAFASRLAPTMDFRRSQDAHTPQNPVGASLLAKRPVLSAFPSTVMPPSRAGSLPQWIFGGHKMHIHRKTLWERACSRRGRYFQHLHRLSHRLREQARSHIGFVAVTRCAYAAKSCGSELAREEAGTSSMSIDRDTAFASRLAPT